MKSSTEAWLTTEGEAAAAARRIWKRRTSGQVSLAVQNEKKSERSWTYVDLLAPREALNVREEGVLEVRVRGRGSKAAEKLQDYESGSWRGVKLRLG